MGSAIIHQTILFVESTLRQLQMLHLQRRVHCNLRPETILSGQTPAGEIRVTILGRDCAVPAGQYTPGVDLLINPSVYTAPELLRGIVTPAVDVYAIGVLVYKGITGRFPQPGNLIAPRSLNMQITPLLAQVCLKALSTNPADRYQNAAEMLKAIELWTGKSNQKLTQRMLNIVHAQTLRLPANFTPQSLFGPQRVLIATLQSTKVGAARVGRVIAQSFSPGAPQLSAALFSCIAVIPWLIIAWYAGTQPSVLALMQNDPLLGWLGKHWQWLWQGLLALCATCIILEALLVAQTQRRIARAATLVLSAIMATTGAAGIVSVVTGISSSDWLGTTILLVLLALLGIRMGYKRSPATLQILALAGTVVVFGMNILFINLEGKPIEELLRRLVGEVLIPSAFALPVALFSWSWWRIHYQLEAGPALGIITGLAGGIVLAATAWVAIDLREALLPETPAVLAIVLANGLALAWSAFWIFLLHTGYRALVSRF